MSNENTPLTLAKLAERPGFEWLKEVLTNARNMTSKQYIIWAKKEAAKKVPL